MIKQPKAENVGSPAVDAAAGLVVAGTALANPIAGVVAAVVIPVFQDVAKRLLSPREASRVERVEALVRQRIAERVAAGEPLRSDLDVRDCANVAELLEGSLLAARDAYEERKLPLIANLCAGSLFTDAPMENLNQTLLLAERLSYRQLCILAVYAPLVFSEAEPELSGLAARNMGTQDETWKGVFEDLRSLLQEGILAQDDAATQADLVFVATSDGKSYVSSTTSLVPNRLCPTYLGVLLVDGLLLQDIPNEDLESVRSVLGRQPEESGP